MFKKNKLQKYFLSVIGLLFIVLSFLFGYFNFSTRFEANMMNLHDLSVNDSKYQFVHSNVIGRDDLLSGKDSASLIDLTNSTDTSRTILNPYCYLSHNNEKEIYDFSVDDLFNITDLSICGIHLYADTNMMQNIALPLFINNGIKITKGRNGADFGCYISASTADVILNKYATLYNYAGLIEKGIKLRSVIGGKEISFSINNIYFDYESLQWDENNKTDYVKYHGKYNEFFSNFNKNAIFIAIKDVFPNHETNFCCDLKEGYGSTSIYINNVLSNAPNSEKIDVEFYLDLNVKFDKPLFMINESGYFVDNVVAILLLVFSIVVYVVFIIYLNLLCRKKLILSDFLKLLFPSLCIFLLCFTLPYFIGMFGINCKYVTYLAFNKIGNEIVLIGLLIAIFNVILLRIGKRG